MMDERCEIDFRKNRMCSSLKNSGDNFSRSLFSGCSYGKQIINITLKTFHHLGSVPEK